MKCAVKKSPSASANPSAFMNISIHKLVILFGLLTGQTGFGQDLKVLANHLGYEQDAPKRAVILGHADDTVDCFFGH